MYEDELNFIRTDYKIVHSRNGKEVKDDFQEGDTIELVNPYVVIKLTGHSDPLILARTLVNQLDANYEMGKHHIRMRFKRLLK